LSAPSSAAAPSCDKPLATDGRRAVANVTVFPPSQLTRHQRYALSALRSRPVVKVGSFWRIKGAPAPIVNAFALATLLDLGLVAEAEPGRVVLTSAGRAVTDRLEQRMGL